MRISWGLVGGSERFTPPNPQATPRLPPGNPQVTPSVHRTNNSYIVPCSVFRVPCSVFEVFEEFDGLKSLNGLKATKQ